MESDPYLNQLQSNKARLEQKIANVDQSNPEQAAHLPRLKAHLADLRAAIEKHTPKAPEKPKIKKNAPNK